MKTIVKTNILLLTIGLLMFNSITTRNLQTEEGNGAPDAQSKPAYYTDETPEQSVSTVKCPPADQMPYIKMACTSYSVCGYLEKCENGNCQIQFKSSCEACTYGGISYYEEKDCDQIDQAIDPIPSIMPIRQEMYKCSEEERKGCEAKKADGENVTSDFIYYSICAVTDECSGDTTKCKSYESTCSACQDPLVNYYFYSNCSEQFEPMPLPIIDFDMFYSRNVCDDYSRSINCSDYFSDEYEYPTVCAFIKDCDFTKEQCFLSKKNKCDACIDNNVIEFSDKPCPEITKCKDKKTDEKCNEYAYVCGFKSDCTEGICYVDVPSCDVCNNDGIESFFNYDCSSLTAFNKPKEIYKCTDEDRDESKACNKMYEGVCAHKKDDCVTDCQVDEANFCTACKNKEISWVENVYCRVDETLIDYLYDTPNLAPTVKYGENADDVNNNEAKALAGAGDINVDAEVSVEIHQGKRCLNNGEVCTQVYEPVCAFKKCASGLCPIEKSNSCIACVDKTVEYYVESVCSSVSARRIDVPCIEKERVAQCSENAVMNRNVCGRYNMTATNCEDDKCFKNFNSVCDACSENNILQYYEGECWAKIYSISLVIISLVCLIL